MKVNFSLFGCKNREDLPCRSLACPVDRLLFQAPLKEDSGIKVFTGSDINSLSELNLEREDFNFGFNDYGFFNASTYSAKNLSNDSKFVKVVLGDSVQISRIEITYTP